MKKMVGSIARNWMRFVLLGLGLFAAAGGLVAFLEVPRAFSSPADMSDAALLDGYRHVEVASVSDAIEKINGAVRLKRYLPVRNTIGETSRV